MSIRSRRPVGSKRWLAAATATLAVCGLAAAVLPERGSSVSHNRTGAHLAGRFTLFTSAQPQPAPCAPRHGYRDIVAGASVVVRDETGATVGIGRLSAGSAEPSERGCVFRFTINPLPAAPAYTISVGKRGGLPYSYADLENSGWTVTMGLGALSNQ